MSYINVLFPLRKSGQNIGFDSASDDEIGKAVVFNLRNIILTNPGEMTWDMNFGVGIKDLLFEQLDQNVLQEYEIIILGQLESYAPYIEVNNLRLYEVSDNSIKIDLNYSINRTDITDTLEIIINQPI